MKKSLILITVLAIVLCTVSAVFAEDVKVTFKNTDPTTKGSYEDLNIIKGNALQDTDYPDTNAEGYVFDGWIDENTGLAWDPSDPVTEDTTLIGVWREFVPDKASGNTYADQNRDNLRASLTPYIPPEYVDYRTDDNGGYYYSSRGKEYAYFWTKKICKQFLANPDLCVWPRVVLYDWN